MQNMKQPIGGHKASLCQRGLRAHWPALILIGTFPWAVYKSSEIRKNKEHCYSFAIGK